MCPPIVCGAAFYGFGCGYMILELFKKIALEAVECEKPVAVMLGVCTDGGVMVEERLELGSEHLVVMKGVEAVPGDRVVLLREQGGQRFFVLGVI
jgi:hypothetical protein